MAGAVAVAAVMEDFESQPCKKIRKDAEAPHVKTIASYFTPKSVEKPFSPPRSNNIMDYFKRTSPAQEIKSCSQVSKENSLLPSELVGGGEIPGKALKSLGLKRTRKTKEKKSKEEDEEEPATDDIILIENHKSPVMESTKACDTSTIQDKTGHHDKESSMGKIPADVLKDSIEPKSKKDASTEREKSKNKKSGLRRNRKAKSGCEEAKHCSGSVQEFDQPVCDAEPEEGAHKTSTENTSTVTISYKDFVLNESLKEDEEHAVSSCDGDVTEASAEMNRCSEQGEPGVVPLQVSPRILTVQAEVHPVSPDLEFVKVAKDLKVASIFSRNKRGQGKKVLNLNVLNPEVKQDVLPDRKRKSNVVLEEEDLVLDVMELSPSVKSTETERKLFMNAFKQPSFDGLKSKPNKGQSKVNQNQEKIPEEVDKEPEDTPLQNIPEISSKQTEEPKNITCEKKKRGRKPGKNRVALKDEDLPLDTQELKEIIIIDVDDKKESSQVKGESTQTVRRLRRSTRELSHRQAVAKVNTNSKSQKEKQTSKSQDDVFQNTPTLVSTPKVHRPKRGIYRAEMLCPPDIKGSPIRMKISRVPPLSATKAGDFEISSPLSTRECNALKKRKQAKKLVDKAKALQQSKKDNTKVKETLRRSTRSKESSINYYEDEDSVVFLDESKRSPVNTRESNKSQKKLRSLNEVLGKGASHSKACKTPTGAKPASLFDEKKAQRPSGVISIFDDSSREASENSQDDEQFRAKREFLKSGLPDSFKKQIAKTAASREAYSQACALFQTVVHVQQRAADCLTWNLQWPTNPFLMCLKYSYDLPPLPLMCLEKSLGYTKVPTKKIFNKLVYSRKEMPEAVRHHLLEEIKISNPSFPHQRFFMRFVKRREDYLLQFSAPVDESRPICPTESSDSIGRKRKRVDEGEGTGKVGKKPKSSHTDDEVILIDGNNSASEATLKITEPLPSGRSRRERLQRQKQNKEPKTAKDTSPGNNQNISPEAVCTEDGEKEDMLWTEKYQPHHSCDLIGNIESVRKLHSWLKEWKLRADREEKRKQQEKQQDVDADESWLMGEGLEDMEDLCNTLLISGPTGVGKTAAVYACAQELGFKVFEVNSSSQRSGRQILSQLKEATQSHQVDIQGVNAHKPSYFSNYSSLSINTKPGASPRKVNSPRRVVSSPRKPPQSPRSNSMRRGGLAPTSLASFFKAGARPASKEANNQDKKAQTALKTYPKKESVKKSTESACATTMSTKISVEDQGKRAATSLILFEEVDVIFDDDTGFLAAIKTFNATTKRPVILTTSDPTFAATFDGYFEEIHFKAPSVADVSSYLQLLCLAENIRTDFRDISSLLDLNRCDIRQSLLHLQFWACSGGKQVKRPLPTSDVKCDSKGDNQKSLKSENPCGDGLPPCHRTSTESFLGIQNFESENVKELLLKDGSSVPESIKCWDILSEVQRRGVNLLYSNMESLLPLPTHSFLPSTIRSQPAPNTLIKPEHLPQTLSLDVLDEPSDDCSPLKVSSRMKGRKKLAVVNKDVFDSDSDDDFLSLPKPSKAHSQKTEKEPGDKSCESERVAVKKQRPVLTEAERKKSEPVLQCLSSLADYMDHMSFLDSFQCQLSQTEGFCRPYDCGWTGAEIKSGMTDDVRLDCGNQVNGMRAEEIHAILGHLSFGRCRADVSKSWDRAQQLEEDIRREAEVELSLPVAQHRQGFSLAQTSPCDPRVTERRREAMRSVLSSRSAGVLGNRTAVSLDYLPSLRAICRSERLKEQGKIKRRFLHYLDNINFTLPKSTVEFLASEFP